MRQIEIFDIPSPCIHVCDANSQGYCRGCLRSREERMRWNGMSNEERREVLRLCVERKRRALREIIKKRLQKPDSEPSSQGDLFTSAGADELAGGGQKG